MKYIFLLLTLFICVSCATSSMKTDNKSRGVAEITNQTESEKNKTFDAWQGQIDLRKLEAVLTQKIGATVKVQSMRWTRDPFDYVAYFMGKIIDGADGGYAYYVINFKLDGTHDVSCGFLMVLSEEKSIVTDCRSPTAKVNVSGSLENKDIGLPYKKRY